MLLRRPVGRDPSHHPVDLELAARVAGYIAGSGSIDDLYQRAFQATRTRLRTTAWQNEMVHHHHRGTRITGFQTMLHAWGRPFLVTVDGADAIASMIDRYLDARDFEEVDAIVEENLAVFDTGLFARVRPAPTEVSHIDLEREVRLPIELLRLARPAAKLGPVRLPFIGKAARGHLEADAAFQIVRFCARLRPGWMDRGYVWPQALFHEAGIQSRNLFERPTPILGALALSSFDFAGDGTPANDFTLGGYVPPYKVPLLRDWIESHRSELERCYSRTGEPDTDIRLSVRKTCEALDDAKLRGFGFVEALDVYGHFFSGPN